jgi:hypothetical protein
VKKLLLTGLWMLLLSGSAFAADGPKEVEAAIRQGNYTLAEQDLRQAIVEHPQSAKAHYMLAQVLAHEGNIGDAQKEAGQAKAIDPKISFTDPAKFNRFQAELNQALAPSTGAHSGAAMAPAGGAAAPYAAAEQPAAAQPRSRGSIWPWVIGAVIVFLLFGWFRRRQQSAAINQGYGNQGYGAPGPQNPYGNGPYPPPGYQSGPQGGSGIGGSILGGLAGGVLGAAAVNAYENHERREEENRGDYAAGNGSNFAPANPQDQAYDQLRNQPIDTGNNDDSWDDNSGGGGDSFDGGGDDSWS